MTKEVINVNLYGGKGIFGGKETPLQADVISCGKYQSCSYFQNGQCLKVRSFGGSGCQFGSVSTIRGYTSRAKKYGEFKRQWQGHEKYNKLNSPPTKLGLIDGVVVFPYPFATIKKTDSGSLYVGDPMLFGNGIQFVPYEEFTVNFIHELCTYRPQAVMGGEITKYQKETVPLFLSHLEEVLPERYEEFISEYPSFVQKIDYIGRKALLKTINPSKIYKESDRYPNLNSEWYWDGEFLNYKSGYISDVSVINHYEVEEMKLKPSDKTVVKITSNEQVAKNTVFVD